MEFNETDVRKFYKFLNHKTETEVRLISLDGKPPLSIFCHSEDEFVDACKRYNGNYQVYVGLNERNKEGTKNEDVQSYNVFFLDIDPKNFRGESASEEQIKKAKKTADNLIDYLAQIGIEQPEIAFSGNGYHIYKRLPENDAKNLQHKIRFFLKQVQDEFENDFAKIDNVGDAARIAKVPGTVSIKGKDHRVAKCLTLFVSKPDNDFLKFLETLEENEQAQPTGGGLIERLEKARKKDKKLSELLDGSISGFKSRSEAEMAACKRLYFWNFESSDINYIMSAYSRIGKWKEKSKAYCEITLKKACTGERFTAKEGAFKGKGKDEEEKKIEKNFVVDGNVIVQQIAGSRFCIYNGNATYAEYYTDSQGSKIFPLSGKEVDARFVVLPEEFQEPGSVHDLTKEIVEFSRKYVDIPDEMRIFCAYYVVHSWVFDKANTTAYLRFIGDTGTGKSRAVDVFGQLCYNYILVSGAATVAPIYRIIQKWRGTLGFEESDLKGSDETNELIKIINCGIEKGRFVVRCDKENLNNIDFFDAFSPKIFAARHPFVDLATEGRCLSITTQATKRKDIAPVLPEIFMEDAKRIRNKLLGYRMKNWNLIKEVQDVDLGNIFPRLKQMGYPFLPLFVGDEENFQIFKDFLIGYQRKLKEEHANSWVGQVVQALIDETTDASATGAITSKMVAEDLKVSVSSISRELRSLGFESETTNIYVKMDGEDKRKTIRKIVASNEVWLKTMDRYTIDGDTELPQVLRKSIKNQTTLI